MNIKALALTALVAISPAAFADHDHRDKRYDRGNHHSKHYNKHQNKGEAINRKFDRKAAKAARHGNYEKAARLDRKGDRIERRYNNAYRNHGYQGILTTAVITLNITTNTRASTTISTIVISPA